MMKSTFIFSPFLQDLLKFKEDSIYQRTDEKQSISFSFFLLPLVIGKLSREESFPKERLFLTEHLKGYQGKLLSELIFEDSLLVGKQVRGLKLEPKKFSVNHRYQRL